MRTLKLIVFILTATVTLFGCKKKAGGAKNDTYYFKATVDGVVKESSTSIDANISKDGKLLGIYGRYGGNVAGFDINITQFTGPGTYIMTPASDLSKPLVGIGIYREDNNPRENHIYSTSLDNGTGKVIVTSYENNIISGNFEFKGLSQIGTSKTVTNGSFRAKLVVN
jgi:hypothetical protein